MPQAVTQAAAFEAQHQEFFFQDAHFLVEASAKAEAQEVAYNVFEFKDGSILRIENGRGTTAHYASSDALVDALRQAADAQPD